MQSGPPHRPQHGMPPTGTPPRTAPPRTVPPPLSHAPQQASPVAMPLPQLKPLNPVRRGLLRFFAASCIGSAWLTLVLTLVTTVSLAMIPSAMETWSNTLGPATGGGPGLGRLDPSNPLGGNVGNLADPDAPDGLIPSGRDMLPALPNSPGGLGGATSPVDMAKLMVGVLGGRIWLAIYLAAALQLVTGIVFFLMLLALGKLTYAHLELEEQAQRLQQSLQLVLARLQPPLR